MGGKDFREFDRFAFPHDPSDDPEFGQHVEATWVRVMPEPNAGVPLWDAEGHLGDDHAWLHSQLGLSVELLVELTAWNEERERTRIEDHDRRGRELTERVRAEIKSGFQVFYKP